MNQTAPEAPVALDAETDGPATVSLRVVGAMVKPARDPVASDPEPEQQHCLVCLVPLERPKIASSQTRRLALKNSLAGNDPSRNAGILARDPHFWDYLQQFNLAAYDGEIDTRRSRHFINRVCGVSGRHELDRESVAGQRFFTLIEQPFLDWLLAAEGD